MFHIVDSNSEAYESLRDSMAALIVTETIAASDSLIYSHFLR